MAGPPIKLVLAALLCVTVVPHASAQTPGCASTDPCYCDPALVCSSTVVIPDSEIATLLRIRDIIAAQALNTTTIKLWDPAFGPPCVYKWYSMDGIQGHLTSSSSWPGVACNEDGSNQVFQNTTTRVGNGHVVGLSFSNSLGGLVDNLGHQWDLYGEFSAAFVAELANLPYMQTLNMPGNYVRGDPPPEIIQLFKYPSETFYNCFECSNATSNLSAQVMRNAGGGGNACNQQRNSSDCAQFYANLPSTAPATTAPPATTVPAATTAGPTPAYLPAGSSCPAGTNPCYNSPGTLLTCCPAGCGDTTDVPRCGATCPQGTNPCYNAQGNENVCCPNWCGPSGDVPTCSNVPPTRRLHSRRTLQA